jgi:hypothetical protein
MSQGSHGSSASGGAAHGQGRENEPQGGSNGVPVLNAPLPQPPAPPMTPEEMLAEMLAARRESTRALELVAQLVGGLVRGGQGEGGRQGDGAHGYDRPSTYHDFLKT